MSTKLKKQRTLFGGKVPDKSKPQPIMTGNVASDAAAEFVRPRVGGQCDRIMAAMRNAGQNGLTDLEIEKATVIGPNSVRPRRLELQRRGYVKLLLGPTLLPVLRDGYSVWVETNRQWPLRNDKTESVE